MRGRTNASNGGIFLNATTDSFEVATGNAIVAGDFCEYIYDTGITPLVSTFGNNSYLVDDATHTYIALIGDYPTLYTYINKEITIVSTFQTASTCLIQLDATHYFVFNDTSKNVGLISCTTSAITLIDEEYSTSTSAWSFTRVNATTMVYQHSNSYYLYIASTDENYTTVTLTSKNLLSSTNYIVGATSTTVALCTSTSSSGTYTNTIRLYDASTFNQVDYFSVTTYDNFRFGFFPNIVFDDRFFLTYCIHKVYKSSSYYYYPYFYILDSVDKRSVTTLAFNDVSNSSPSFSLSPINSQNKFIVKEGQYMYWVAFDSALSTLTKSEYTTSNNNGNIYGFNTYDFALMINNQGYTNLDTSSGKVVIGTPTDKVKEWQGSGNPMGVAKQSGTAGDTIEVYIPATNV